MFSVIDEILTAGYKNQVKSQILGKAIQLSHKNIKKKKYIDELESRLPTTVRMFNKQDEEIKNLSQKFDKECLSKSYTEYLNKYICFLTCSNFIEAMAEGDCLCMTFSLIRPEQAIMVPSTIHITGIYPTVISAQSFMNAIKYSINLNFDNDSESNELVVVGEARESINGCLPLFINKDHWEVSKILIDRILGWIVTLDPMGYQINQKLTFPYILLEYSLEQYFKNPNSEFYKNYYSQVLDICLNVMLEENKKENSNFKENLNQTYSSYLKLGVNRTPDSISKNSILFIKYYCAVLLDWVKPGEETQEIFYFLVEEEFRRLTDKIYSNYYDYSELNINNEEIYKNEEEKIKVIDKYVDLYSKVYKEKFLVMRIILHLISNHQIGIKNFNEIKLADENELCSELKIANKHQIYAMFFQNQVHHDSSIRRKAFSDNLYFDCRTNSNDVFIYYSKVTQEMKEKRQKQNEQSYQANIDLSNLRLRFANIEVINLLKLFRLSESMKESEEILDKALKLKPGRAVHYYFNIFYGLNDIPLIYEKLLLLKKKHKNFKRAIKTKHNYDLCYFNLLSLDQIVDVFGLKKIPRYFRNKYKQLYK
jgi:hypothetical protein